MAFLNLMLFYTRIMYYRLNACVFKIVEDYTLINNVFNKPFILFMGPQRAGTTWLDAYCRHRGDVCLPSKVKEVFFFDRHSSRGAEFYKSHFDLKSHHDLIAEVTTTSFDHADAPRRVKEMFGNNVTLICPLRKPVPRSYSLYRHYARYGLVSGDLIQACEQEPQIINSSRYAYHIERWLEVFPNKKIHFIFQEELENNRDEFVRKLCSLLEVEYMPVPEGLNERINVSTKSNNKTLAGIGQKTCEYLRDRKLYSVINLTKHAGLKTLFFGKEKPDAPMLSMSDFERDWLDEQLGGEVQRLEKIIGPIPQWEKC